jgi:hypothetical protein
MAQAKPWREVIAAIPEPVRRKLTPTQAAALARAEAFAAKYGDAAVVPRAVVSAAPAPPVPVPVTVPVPVAVPVQHWSARPSPSQLARDEEKRISIEAHRERFAAQQARREVLRILDAEEAAEKAEEKAAAEKKATTNG